MRHVEAFQQLDVFFAKALAYGCKSVCRCWRYYAAPTELTAIWMPVAIKILLLRSTISVFQMSKLPGALLAAVHVARLGRLNIPSRPARRSLGEVGRDALIIG